MRNDRAFLGKSFDVLSFLRQITQRNEERKVGVAMSGGAEHGIELALHVFPNAVSPRPDHHAATHVRRLGQLRRPDHLLIPLRKVFIPARADCAFSWVRVRHRDRIKRAT